MSPKIKLLLLIPFTALVTYANTITFAGPDFPRPGANQGLPCNPATDIGCVIGDPAFYEVFSASLTQPTTTNPNWVLTIQTNYGDPALKLIPGSPNVVPSFLYEAGISFSMGDFLISTGGNIYGIVLSPHDGYAAGSIYKATGFQTSNDIMGGKGVNVPNPSHNVWIAAGGTLVGSGTLTGAITGDAIKTAKYTLTDQFSAPPSFLSINTPFSIDFSSYACANSIVVGTSSFTGNTGGGGGGGGGNQAPEPGTWLMVLPVLFLLGFRMIRQRGIQVS